MTPALRWAAMRAILMFHNWEGQSHKTVSTDHNFCGEGEPKRNRTEAVLLISLMLNYHWAKLAHEAPRPNKHGAYRPQKP